MRPFEMLLTLACAAWLIRFAAVTRPESPCWSVGLQILLGTALAVQVLLEGWRAQMFPVYAVAILAASGAPAALFSTATLRLCFAAAGLVATAASISSAMVFQQLTLPRPSGTSLVGVTTLGPVTRAEPSPRPSDGESLPPPLVRLWYPAAPRPLAQRVREFLKARLEHSLKSTDTVPAAADVAVEPGSAKFPVLAYFGGWPEDSVQNRSLICELVSRGFVVASFQYPAELAGMSPADLKIQQRQLARPMLYYTSEAAFRHTVDLDNERARAYARDASATLDELAALNTSDSDRRFPHRLNLEQAGILGFSFGGAVAAQATHMDPRFKAAVNLDGRHWAEALQEGVAVPYMFVGEELLMPTPAMLTSTDPATRYEAIMDQIDYTQLAKNLRANGGIQVTIEGMAHLNFMDDVLRSPLRRFSGGGVIDAQRGLLIVNSLVVEFFGQQLAQRPAPLLAANTQPFPEARAEYWPAPPAASAHLPRADP
jgi:predicted dienelactone hydrolase